MKSIISPFFIFCLGTLNRLRRWSLLTVCISGLAVISAFFIDIGLQQHSTVHHVFKSVKFTPLERIVYTGTLNGIQYSQEERILGSVYKEEAWHLMFEDGQLYTTRIQPPEGFRGGRVYEMYILKKTSTYDKPFLQARIVPLPKEKKVKQVEIKTPMKSWLPLLKEIKTTGLFIFIVAITLQVGIPSRKTLIAMRATKFITVGSVVKAIEVGGHFKDVVKRDVIDIIEAIEGKVNKKKSKKK